MPRGEPTEVVRLPVWIMDMYRAEAERRGLSVTEALVKKLAPSGTPLRNPAPMARCQCAVPVLSKSAPVCTVCKRPR